MARAPENIPSTATVTNNTAQPIVLGNVIKIPASAVGHVINFAGLEGREFIAPDSQRVRAWSGLVALTRVTAARPSTQLTLTSTAPALARAVAATGVAAELTITVASATGIAVGDIVTGVGIGAGAKVTDVTALVVTVDVANAGTVNGTVTFTGAGELPALGADDYDYPGAKRAVAADVVTHTMQP
jgi:hypothetical protein